MSTLDASMFGTHDMETAAFDMLKHLRWTKGTLRSVCRLARPLYPCWTNEGEFYMVYCCWFVQKVLTHMHTNDVKVTQQEFDDAMVELDWLPKCKSYARSIVAELYTDIITEPDVATSASINVQLMSPRYSPKPDEPSGFNVNGLSVDTT